MSGPYETHAKAEWNYAINAIDIYFYTGDGCYAVQDRLASFKKSMDRQPIITISIDLLESKNIRRLGEDLVAIANAMEKR